jgi:hypothetical protein
MALLAAARAAQGDAPDTNQLANGGFESGRAPWYSLHPPDFVLADARSRTGARSALLQMRAAPEQEGAQVRFLVQEISPAALPRHLSGWYLVEGWKTANVDAYLQLVVIAFDASNRPFADVSNHQLRYLLAGIDHEPFAVANAKFVFIEKSEPVLGECVHFLPACRGAPLGGQSQGGGGSFGSARNVRYAVVSSNQTGTIQHDASRSVR